MQYQFDDFVLDPDNFELKKNNQSVELRAKAFHVLAFLLKNRHRMVTKDELLDEVWHKQFIAESTLNSCIKTVRQTLGDDGKNQEIIQTVRGMGYRFVAPVEMVKPANQQQPTISKRLTERLENSFIGREREIGLVADAFSQSVMPFWVCYMYGAGGIGKTSLLKNIGRKLSKDGLFLYIDCREHEPTQEGFLKSLIDALSAQQNSQPGTSQEYTVEHLSQLFSECNSKILVCLDQFESFHIIESWMRQKFFPALPDSVLTVIASRQAPKAAWYTNSEWANAFQIIELGELSENDSREMLSSRNLDEQQIIQVRRFAKGYPLALELAAMLYRTQPGYQFSGSLAPVEVVSQLATSVLSGLPDAEKEAIEALSMVNRANEPMLCTLLGLRDAQRLFVKLRELPFVNYSAQGISLHDVVRDAIGKDLSYRDPVRSCTYRRNILAFFRDESNKVPYQRLWQLTADLLFLIDQPLIRSAYFPAGSSEFTIQQAALEDKNDIISISQSAEPSQMAEITQQWLLHYPQHFYVAKKADNTIAGFEYFFTPDTVDLEILKDDPVSSAWLNHLNRYPVEEGERCIFFRRWLTEGIGDASSPAQGAFWVDIKRVYMSMRPNLRRLYMVCTHIDEYLPAVRSLGFTLLQDCEVTIADVKYHTVMVDFGEKSVDGWLIQLVKNQIEGEQSACFATA